MGFVGSQAGFVAPRRGKPDHSKQRRFSFGTHANTAHVWAQQNPETESGHSGDSRISFDGPTIFSYGSHYALASFAGEHKGRRVVLLNDRGYSVSTGKHKSHVRYALNATDIMIRLPDLTEFLHRPKINEAHESILESVAASIRDNYGVAENRDALAAFRALFKPRAKVPADIVAWSDNRKAQAVRAAFQEKLGDARKIVSDFSGDILAAMNPEYRTPNESASTYTIQDRVGLFSRHISKLYSARGTLAKAKAARKHIKTCSSAIAILTGLRQQWQALHAPASRRELRESRLETLRGWNPEIKDGARRWHSDSELGELWALAIAEQLPAADSVGRELQLRLLQSEMPRGPGKPEWYYSSGPRVTLEQWLNGDGKASQYHFDGTHVRRKGDNLETSLGATCPFSHAVAAFLVAQRCKQKGESWASNGHKIRVGHFGVDRIESDGTLRAGCHTLTYDSMLALAVREIPQQVRPTYGLPAVI